MGCCLNKIRALRTKEQSRKKNLGLMKANLKKRNNKIRKSKNYENEVPKELNKKNFTSQTQQVSNQAQTHNLTNLSLNLELFPAKFYGELVKKSKNLHRLPKISKSEQKGLNSLKSLNSSILDGIRLSPSNFSRKLNLHNTSKIESPLFSNNLRSNFSKFEKKKTLRVKTFYRSGENKSFRGPGHNLLNVGKPINLKSVSSLYKFASPISSKRSIESNFFSTYKSKFNKEDKDQKIKEVLEVEEDLSEVISEEKLRESKKPDRKQKPIFQTVMEPRTISRALEEAKARARNSLRPNIKSKVNLEII